MVQNCGNLLVVAQGGRLQYEALLFAASLRANDPGFDGTLYVAEPQPGPLWDHDPRINGQATRQALLDLGAQIVPFESRLFGQTYPHGNKIEALQVLPKGQRFTFFDSDTLVTGRLSSVPLQNQPPTASMNRTNTWPVPELYGPGITDIWKSLYDKFGLPFETSLNLAQPEGYWQRYLYFNAGWFTGPCPERFGNLFAQYASEIRDDPPEALVCQILDPWLDQVALPLVIHALGGGRPGPELSGLDGDITCHWRVLPLLYARESDAVVQVLEQVCAPNKIKKVLKEYEPFRRMVYQGRGQKVRAMFDRENLPKKEQAIRNKIKAAKLWVR